MAEIEIRNLGIDYRKPNSDEVFAAVDDISLSIAAGEFVSIVGSSGCGKSTLLLSVAGLVKIARGTITIGGRPVSGPGPDRAVVFQDASLLPWRTVLGNVRFGLEMQRWTGGDLTERAMSMIKLVGLARFADYHPHQLSGGMRQRVNIARALAVDPQVLLMDEPFGALDAQTREIMGGELLRIWEGDKKTALFVTHDIDEAIFLSDKVVVMGRNPGHIKEVIAIDLPRPRTQEILDTPQFTEYRRRLRAHLAADMAGMHFMEEAA
ncbi:ABC transporter ATP-binding protein [Chelativorans sp. SCAU2101]|jgi:ABC-type nitrate/sulfonate/bicarbonate transport system, ATPase component|uniref:ABC transporter ATP-binding protein n=1 Tax=Chelativorans petroleitrophicus TaxID=2975484 RepID=A0A9X2X985_9HYPH|nr:ABC transporter ATP-binding protein [Chelativorans petroleitrophicus]MCT8990461.1 ABC transporter ATP-binding protein [Chelativorans petroleitrophicus]